MDSPVASLIATLQQAISLEVRSSSQSNEYLEAVLSRKDLQRCYALLTEALGPAAKEFGRAATFEPKIQNVIDAMGGIWIDQCLFLKPSGTQHLAYAALWPWASDPTRVTLKVGVCELR